MLFPHLQRDYLPQKRWVLDAGSSFGLGLYSPKLGPIYGPMHSLSPAEAYSVIPYSHRNNLLSIKMAS